jgi:hypothetical protein
MRHLWSLLSGLAAAVIAAALFAIVPEDVHGRLNVARIVVAGVILGLVAATRISPAGPIAGGLLLLTPVILLEISAGLYASAFTDDFVMRLGGLHLTWFQVGRNDGSLALAGAMMIMAAVSRQRWLPWPKPVAALVDNGSAGGPNQANDGTTAQLWV